MSQVTVTQRNANRNQSTADYQLKKIAIWDNRFVEGIFKNTTGAQMTLTPGNLIIRSKTIVDGFEIATYTDVNTNTLSDIIGIAVQEGDIVLANNATININAVVSGVINSDNIVPPAGVTLDTVAGNKVLKDVLNALGMHLEASTENTKFDN